LLLLCFLSEEFAGGRQLALNRLWSKDFLVELCRERRKQEKQGD